eukprot:gene21261-8053_t
MERRIILTATGADQQPGRSFGTIVNSKGHHRETNLFTSQGRLNPGRRIILTTTGADQQPGRSIKYISPKDNLGERIILTATGADQQPGRSFGTIVNSKGHHRETNLFTSQGRLNPGRSD